LGSIDADLNAYDGHSNTDTAALQAFAAFEPEDSPLRIYAAAILGRSDSDIRRGYLNGVAPVSSSGSRDGHMAGVAISTGWTLAPIEDATLTPFIRYDAIHLKLAGYEEADGPFPARFNAVEDTLEVARIGIEAQRPMTRHIDARATLALVSRLTAHTPGISGEVLGIGDFALPGARLEHGWTEGSVGLAWRVRPGTDVRVHVGGSTDGDTAPEFNAMVGISARL
jgi:hypothetical protein